MSAHRPTRKYVNFQLYNQNVTPTLNADMQLTTNDDIVPDTGLYDLSLIRFSIDTSTIPLMIIPIDTSQAGPVNVNRTVYSFTMQDAAGNEDTNFVEWIPEFSDAPVPTVVNPQDVSTEYYYLNSLQHIINLFNVAIEQCELQLQAVNPVAGRLPPYFRINPSTNALELWAQSDHYDNNTDPAPVTLTSLWCNQEASSLLQYFLSKEIRDVNVATDKYFQFGIGNINGLNVFEQPTLGSDIIPPNQAASAFPSGTWTIMPQYKSSLACFNTFQGIDLILTSGLAIVNEIETPGVDYGSEIANNVSTEDLQPIITSFQVDPDIRLASGSGRFIYIPQGEYRLISMLTSLNIKNIAISFRWVDTYGNKRPIKLQRNTSANALLMMQPRQLEYYEMTQIIRESTELTRSYFENLGRQIVSSNGGRFSGGGRF